MARYMWTEASSGRVPAARVFEPEDHGPEFIGQDTPHPGVVMSEGPDITVVAGQAVPSSVDARTVRSAITAALASP